MKSAWSRARRFGPTCQEHDAAIEALEAWLQRFAQRRDERSLGVTVMSTFEDGRYRWRETYFVLFPAASRPTLKVVEKMLAALNKRYRLSNLGADAHGRFESLTLISPDDFAALDICFTSGAEVLGAARGAGPGARARSSRRRGPS